MELKSFGFDEPLSAKNEITSFHFRWKNRNLRFQQPKCTLLQQYKKKAHTQNTETQTFDRNMIQKNVDFKWQQHKNFDSFFFVLCVQKHADGSSEEANRVV